MHSRNKRTILAFSISSLRNIILMQTIILIGTSLQISDNKINRIWIFHNRPNVSLCHQSQSKRQKSPIDKIGNTPIERDYRIYVLQPYNSMGLLNRRHERCAAEPVLTGRVVYSDQQRGTFAHIENITAIVGIP